MILTCDEMRTLEAEVFAAGVTADALMEEAGLQMARAIRQFVPRPGLCVAAFGRGNNGGDALVAARHLREWGWEARLLPAFPEAEWGALPGKKFAPLAGCGRICATDLAPLAGKSPVLLDGLLGIGARGPLREPLAGIVAAMNAARRAGNARTFALDAPTGLDFDTGAPGPVCIEADVTLTLGFAKAGLVSDAVADCVGRLCVLPVGEFSKRRDAHGGIVLNTPATLSGLLPRRGFDCHKGDFGRVAIIAGSPGFLGAAVLCAAAAVRAGAGLTTLYATADYHDALAASLPPEVMLRRVATLEEVLAERADVLAIGPGLGRERAHSVHRLIREAKVPAVLDADALNCLAGHLHLLKAAPAARVLTPHPGEMERLVPGASDHPRQQVVREFTARFPKATLLLKGARTCIGENDALSLNTTGSPALAKGGSGDVLTGVIAALLGQGVGTYDAARLGAWLCGRAAESAVWKGAQSEETLTASDLLAALPAAIQSLRGCEF